METRAFTNFRAGNILLLLFSLFFTFVAAEIGYRFHLSRKTLYSYNVASRPFYEYSKELGYNYIPNTKAVAASVRNNKVDFWREKYNWEEKGLELEEVFQSVTAGRMSRIDAPHLKHQVKEGVKGNISF